MKRRGMTVLELTIASGVSVIVLCAVWSAFITSQRMMSTAMAESELMISARQIREKLLYRMSPTINGIHYAGLLSGTNAGQVVESSGIAVLRNQCVGSSLSDLRDQSMRLLVWNEQVKNPRTGLYETMYYLINEHIPNKDKYRKWLWPIGVSLADKTQNEMISYERDTSYSDQYKGVYRVYLGINLKSDTKNLDGSPILRRERVTLPIFGKIQPFQISPLKDVNGDY